MHQRPRLDLPDVPDSRDACVGRLQTLLERQRGIIEIQVADDEGKPVMCFHYDSDMISLAEIKRRARAAGAAITDRYGHAVLRIRAVDDEDGAPRIETQLLGVDGILMASVNLPAQLARVEFDRRHTSLATIEEAIQRWAMRLLTTQSPCQ
jgi:Zn2+/Cd2+-exporting ATPase